jgi:hypothetical protein
MPLLLLTRRVCVCLSVCLSVCVCVCVCLSVSLSVSVCLGACARIGLPRPRSVGPRTSSAATSVSDVRRSVVSGLCLFISYMGARRRALTGARVPPWARRVLAGPVIRGLAAHVARHDHLGGRRRRRCFVGHVPDGYRGPPGPLQDTAHHGRVTAHRMPILPTWPQAHTCTYTHMHSYTLAHTHTCMHSYIHAHMYAHTHTHTLSLSLFFFLWGHRQHRRLRSWRSG